MILLAWNGIAGLRAARHVSPGRLAAVPVLVVDITIMIGLAMLVAAAQPAGTILNHGADLAGQYAVGTTVLWTALRGVSAGLAVVLSSCLMQLVAVLVNGAEVAGRAAVVELVVRITWVVAALTVASAIMAYANRSWRLALSLGNELKTYSTIQRYLDSVHDIVLQDYGHILRTTARTDISSQRVLDDIGRWARQSIALIRARFAQEDSDDRRVGVRFDALGAEFRRRGLDVDVRVDVEEMNPHVGGIVVAGVRELLSNVQVHAGVRRAELAVRLDAGSLVVDVVDRGCGFTPRRDEFGYGLAHSVADRLSTINGRFRIDSRAGLGTKVTLWIPIDVALRVSTESGTPSLDHLVARLSAASRLPGGQSCDHRPWWKRDLSEPEVRAMVHNLARGWLATPVLVYRIFVGPVQVLTGLSEPGLSPGRTMVVALLGYQAVEITVLILAIRGRAGRLLKNPAVLLADFSICAVLNVWAAQVVATAGLPLDVSHQFLFAYTYGAVALWTVVHGSRTGLAVLALALALEVVLTGMSLEGFTVGTALTQCAKLTAAVLVAASVKWSSDRAVARAVQSTADLGKVNSRIVLMHKLGSRSESVLSQVSR
ncbi:signal transduction histidine kinase [Kribbella aluminosa]|uniref:histidine kinase n=1 Tax=Kribbella aluminosa TaxID=416017 RepID=A0ABS4UJK1_9ACTN|nr:ATP-binding protein [Kribbella aluminosa]MBP2351794.1 signal transduction histidine kinase [Kribbella aluminosa]